MRIEQPSGIGLPVSVANGGTGAATAAAARANLGINIASVSLPTSYDATNGIVVDLTGTLSTAIIDVAVLRGSWGGVLFEVLEEGANTFANRKFVVRAKRPRAAFTPSGTNSAPTFTGSALSGHTHTFTGSALGTHTHAPTTNANAVEMGGTIVSNTCGAVACDGNSLQNNTAAKFAAVTAIAAASAGTPAGTNSSDSAGTPAGTVTAPTFTGDAVAAAVAAEVAGATNIQTLTGFTAITCLVIGN